MNPNFPLYDPIKKEGSDLNLNLSIQTRVALELYKLVEQGAKFDS